MLRDKSLIPLSRQHQHALALCVRIERASPIANSDLKAWQESIVGWEPSILIHVCLQRSARENVHVLPCLIGPMGPNITVNATVAPVLFSPSRPLVPRSLT